MVYGESIDRIRTFRQALPFHPEDQQSIGLRNLLRNSENSTVLIATSMSERDQVQPLGALLILGY